MREGFNSLTFILTIVLFMILHRVQSLNSVTAGCQLTFLDRHKLYNFSLTSPLPKYPHGALSEDGFYKVAVNESVLWFQLCDGMIFNHDPPRCVDCLDCGGPARCGMECSALVANNRGVNGIVSMDGNWPRCSGTLHSWAGWKIPGSSTVKFVEPWDSTPNAGYDICTTIGRVSNTVTSIMDEHNPLKGVTVKMSNTIKTLDGSERNCSLSVSVICNSNGVQGPHLLERSDACDYAAELHHPSGCATIVSVHGQGLGWFGTLMIVILCLFGGYILVGAVYRYFFLGIRGLDMIPNLDFWARVPQRIQSSCASLVRKLRGPTEGYRSSYSPVNF